MRVTFNTLTDGVNAINTAASQMSDAQRQLATGRRIALPSDDPLSTSRAIGDHAEISTIDSYTQSADSASSRLSAADTTLSDIVDKLTQALSTATGARGTTATDAVRTAAADAIDGIRASLTSDINTTFQGTYLFSGGQVNSTPYTQTSSGWTYQGDSAPVQVAVQNGRLVSVTFDGQALMQGTDSTDVLSSLDALSTAMRNGDDAGIQTGITAVQNAFSRATRLQTQLGNDEQSVTDVTAQLQSLRLAADSRRSQEEDANMAQAATQLTQSDTAYRAALGAVGAEERETLLDYLPQ